jgi:hypothetical protein
MFIEQYADINTILKKQNQFYLFPNAKIRRVYVRVCLFFFLINDNIFIINILITETLI